MAFLAPAKVSGQNKHLARLFCQLTLAGDFIRDPVSMLFSLRYTLHLKRKGLPMNSLVSRKQDGLYHHNAERFPVSASLDCHDKATFVKIINVQQNRTLLHSNILGRLDNVKRTGAPATRAVRKENEPCATASLSLAAERTHFPSKKIPITDQGCFIRSRKSFRFHRMERDLSRFQAAKSLNPLSMALLSQARASTLSCLSE